MPFRDLCSVFKNSDIKWGLSLTQVIALAGGARAMATASSFGIVESWNEWDKLREVQRPE